MNVLLRDTAQRFGPLERRFEMLDGKVKRLGRWMWLPNLGNIQNADRYWATLEVTARASLFAALDSE